MLVCETLENISEVTVQYIVFLSDPKILPCIRGDNRVYFDCGTDEIRSSAPTKNDNSW